MAQPVRRVATYADIEALPQGVTGEILNGELYAHPRPRYTHARVASNVVRQTGAFDQDTSGPNDPGGWVILIEPELHLGADVVAPDLAAWRVDRATWADDVAFIEISPDWVCEILSEGTEVTDRAVKMPIYAQHGVPWAWLIEPNEKYLEVFRLDAGVLRQHGPTYRGRVVLSVPPFEARPIESWRLWG